MSERFIDLKIRAESNFLLLEVLESDDERKALLHDLRLVIAELDLEVENDLPPVLGSDFITQMESLGSL